MAHFSRQEKIDQILSFIPRSGGLKLLLDLPIEKWARVLASMSEGELDDFLLLLREEQEMSMAIQNQAERKHKVNFTRYMQRLERLRIRLEAMESNPKV